MLAGTAAGLSGAFNFFAFSVGLAIVLVVIKFALEQAEQLVLATIDKQFALATAGEVGPQAGQPASQMAQFQQLSLGQGPLDSGLRLLPWTAAPLLVAPVAGALADRWGRRPVLVPGMLVQGVGLGWFAVAAGGGYGAFGRTAH